jgi:hypothetical protein
MLNWKFLAFCALLFSFDLQAQDASNHPLFLDDWLFRIGGQRADADVKFGLFNPRLGEIPILDLGKTAVDTSVTSVWLDVIWQAPERWSFGLSYFLARADGDRTLDSDFSFGDLEIPAGTGIVTDFETDFYVLSGYYDFFQSANKAAGIGFGVYALDLSASVEVVVGNQTTGNRESASVLAPLPTISAYYKHAFNDNWALRAEVGYLSLNIDEFDGSVFATDISIDYWPNENWGVGAGYAFVDLDLTVDKPIFDQVYKVEYDSFFIFATVGF